MQLLYEGMHHTDVIKLREYLGITSQSRSLLFDSTVQEQLIQYQILHNLAVDGIVGPKTWASLRREYRRTKPSVNKRFKLMESTPLTEIDIDALISICSVVFKRNERNKRIIGSTIATIINLPNLARISTVGELLMFFGQTREEVGANMRLMENANYTAMGLMQVSKYYRLHPDEARADGRGYGHPANMANIFNKMYAGRYGNGSIESGDGLAFSGKGLNQLTFRNNYRSVDNTLQKFGIHLNLEVNPALLANPENCMYGALAYWGKLVHNKIRNTPISESSVNIVTRIYNRYTHSYNSRVKHTFYLLKQIKG